MFLRQFWPRQRFGVLATPFRQPGPTILHTYTQYSYVPGISYQCICFNGTWNIMLQTLLAGHTANPSACHSSGLHANDKSSLPLLPPSQV